MLVRGARALGHTQNAIERGVEHRFLGPRDIKPLEGLVEQALSRGLTGPKGKTKARFLERLDILITLTEKEAHFEFPTLSGSFDYTGIHTRDKRAIKWCRKLFSHYWESTDIMIPDCARACEGIQLVLCCSSDCCSLHHASSPIFCCLSAFSLAFPYPLE